MGKVYSFKITVLVKLNLHWTGKEWTVNPVPNFWTLKCALVTQWKAGDSSHYMLDDEETFLYILILLLPLFCNFRQWVYRIIIIPGENCSENQVRVLLLVCFSYEKFMVWLCLLEFLCPSGIRMNSVCSACIISVCLLIYFHKNCGQHWWITALCINTYPVTNCKSTRCKLNKLIIGEVWIFSIFETIQNVMQDLNDCQEYI